MNKILHKNTANLIVLFRVGLVFIILALLNTDSALYRIAGLFLLLFAALLDWLDGMTETLMIVFFAYKGLVPLTVCILLVAKAFLCDFMRGLNFKKGIGTFQINTSHIGIILVSSNASRILYLLSKIALFIFGSLILILESPGVTLWSDSIGIFKSSVYYGSFLVLAFGIARFILLVYDSRHVIKEFFIEDKT